MLAIAMRRATSAFAVKSVATALPITIQDELRVADAARRSSWNRLHAVMRFPFSRLLTIARLAGWLVVVRRRVAGGSSPIAHAQFALPPLAAAPAAASTSGTLPEPIYWKQDLFLIPYQWGSPAEPAAAQAVWLFVSKDRGASWQKISEAKPQVKAFNYRADGEGEYWFAIRTLDQQGRAWPAGPYQPELRVIVDTTMPRIEELRGQILPNGQIEIAWRCSDANLDPNSLIDRSANGRGRHLATSAACEFDAATPAP